MNTSLKTHTSTNFVNTIQTGVFIGALALLAVLAGWQLIGSWAIPVVAGFAVGIALSVRRTPSRLRLSGARVLRFHEAPEIYQMVGDLSARAGLPNTPEIIYSRSTISNAATFGDKQNPRIVVTAGLLNTLAPRELNAVLAHEIAHIKNGDQKLFRFAEVFRQVTTLFSRIGWLAALFIIPLLLFGVFIPFSGFLLLVMAPVLSYLLEMALLRTREFAADARASEITGDPHALATALGRIEYVQQSLLGRMFPIYRQNETSIFRSHPATHERIEKLMQMDESQRKITR